MSLPKDFKTVNPSDSFYFADNIEKYHIGDNCYHLLSSLNKIADLFNIPVEYVVSAIKELHIPNKCLFEYSSFECKNSLLIGEDLIYTEKTERENYRYVLKKTYHNIYLTEHRYIGVRIPEIIDYLFKEKYSHLYNCFLKRERKYPESLKGVVVEYLKINDLIGTQLEYSDLTCKDIALLINKPETIDMMVSKSLFKHYSNSEEFYLDLGERTIQGVSYPDSLLIPYKALITRDWSLVENQYVCSVIKNEANEKLGLDENNWFKGEQKDAPYFNHPLVEKLKFLFENISIEF